MKRLLRWVFSLSALLSLCALGWLLLSPAAPPLLWRTLHWLLPGEAIATRVSLLGRHLELSPRRVHAGAHTARVGGRIYFQVLDAERALASDADIDARVQDAVLTQLSGALPQLAELSPAERNHCLRDDLRQTLRTEGILLTRLELAIMTNCVG